MTETQEQAKELDQLASLMRGCQRQSETFAVYLTRIESIEAGAAALRASQVPPETTPSVEQAKEAYIAARFRAETESMRQAVFGDDNADIVACARGERDRKLDALIAALRSAPAVEPVSQNGALTSEAIVRQQRAGSGAAPALPQEAMNDIRDLIALARNCDALQDAVSFNVIESAEEALALLPVVPEGTPGHEKT